MEDKACTGTIRCTCARPECMVRRGVDMERLLSVPVNDDESETQPGPPPDCAGACHGKRVDDAARRAFDTGP